MCLYLEEIIHQEYPLRVITINALTFPEYSANAKVKHVPSGLIKVISGQSVLWKCITIARNKDDKPSWCSSTGYDLKRFESICIDPDLRTIYVAVSVNKTCIQYCQYGIYPSLCLQFLNNKKQCWQMPQAILNVVLGNWRVATVEINSVLLLG